MHQVAEGEVGEAEAEAEGGAERQWCRLVASEVDMHYDGCNLQYERSCSSHSIIYINICVTMCV